MPNESLFMILAIDFEALHGIPYIVSTIDELYIVVFASMVGEEDYYC